MVYSLLFLIIISKKKNNNNNKTKKESKGNGRVNRINTCSPVCIRIIYTLLLRGRAEETSKCSGSHAGGDDDAAAASVAASVRRLYNIYIYICAPDMYGCVCRRGVGARSGAGRELELYIRVAAAGAGRGLVVGARTRVARGGAEGRRRPRGQQHNRLLMIREEIDLCYKTVI